MEKYLYLNVLRAIRIINCILISPKRCEKARGRSSDASQKYGSFATVVGTRGWLEGAIALQLSVYLHFAVATFV